MPSSWPLLAAPGAQRSGRSASSFACARSASVRVRRAFASICSRSAFSSARSALVIFLFLFANFASCEQLNDRLDPCAIGRGK